MNKFLAHGALVLSATLGSLALVTVARADAIGEVVALRAFLKMVLG